jgi:hypothetical protein
MSYYIPHANQHRWDRYQNGQHVGIPPIRAGAPLRCLSIRHIDLDDSDFRRHLEDVRQMFSSRGRPVCRGTSRGKCGTCVSRTSPDGRVGDLAGGYSPTSAVLARLGMDVNGRRYVCFERSS